MKFHKIKITKKQSECINSSQYKITIWRKHILYLLKIDQTELCEYQSYWFYTKQIYIKNTRRLIEQFKD